MEKIGTPVKTIRKYCLDCVEDFKEVRECQGDKQYGGECVFYKYRMGRGRPSVKVIRRFCLQCMNECLTLVRNCSSQTCPLLPYRLGHRPVQPGDELKPPKKLPQRLRERQEAIRKQKADKEAGR